MKHFKVSVILNLLTFALTTIACGQTSEEIYHIQGIDNLYASRLKSTSYAIASNNSFVLYQSPVQFQKDVACSTCNALPSKVNLFGKRYPVSIKYNLTGSYDPHSMKEVRMDQNGRGDCIFAWGLLGALIGGISAKSSDISTGSGVLSGFLIGGLAVLSFAIKIRESGLENRYTL